MIKLRIAVALLVLALLMTSCGRKAPPRLPTYEQPPVPRSLTAVHREGMVMLDWDYSRSKLQYVKEFQVIRNDQMLATTEETSYTDTTTEAGKRYEYVVVALSIGGIPSDAFAKVMVDVTEVPPPPSELVAEVVDSGVSLLWNHAGGAVLFNVYRSPDKELAPMLPANPEPLSDNSYTDIPYADKPAYYTVRALVGGPLRHESAPSEALEVRPEDFVPSAPEDLRATVATNNVLIAWKTNPEAWVRSYRIYRSTDGETFTHVGQSRTPSFIDTDGLKGRLYYRVRAMGPAVEGAESEIVTVEVQ